jgi:hypothetical protein
MALMTIAKAATATNTVRLKRLFQSAAEGGMGCDILSTYILSFICTVFYYFLSARAKQEEWKSPEAHVAACFAELGLTISKVLKCLLRGLR